jgi:hypothetical protein
MFLTLLMSLGGGLMRLLPEVVAFFNKRTDNAHELAMLDKQAELEKTRSTMRQEEITTQGQADMNVAELNALSEALKGQMQVTGNRLVDTLNFLVRPVTTYFLLMLYALSKVAMFVLAVQHGVSGWDAIVKVYDDEDRALLSGLLSFWFVGRTLDRQNGHIK